MKTYILIFCLACGHLVVGQKALDTLYANGDKNVALFFPKPIRQGIAGAPHFVFTYNRDQGQYFGLLQAQEGPESNLLVLTEDGRVYSYILKYRKALPRLNHFITENESIGTEVPLEISEPSISGGLEPATPQRESFEAFSDQLLGSRLERLAGKRKRGIGLQLQKMVYHGEATYLVLEVTNRSGIAFEVDYLKVYRISGTKGKKASFQKRELEPLHVHGMPLKVYHGQRLRFVFVLPKFVLGNAEKLQLELRERKGDRKVVLRKGFR